MALTVGIIGCGNISGAHVGGWKAVGDAEVTLLCDSNVEAAEKKRAEFELEADIVADYREAVERDVDAFSICTPTVAHAETSVAALKAGKHVLCEKPMAMNAAEAEQMVAAARDSGRILLIDHRFLFDPLVTAILQALPGIGRPFSLRLRSAHALPLSEGIRKTGCLLDMGYHPLYTALRLMGPAQSVTAFRRQFVRPECSDDNGLVIVDHGSGMSVLESSFSTPGPMGCNRPVEVYGEKGVIIANWFPQPRVTLQIGDEQEELDVSGGSWAGGMVQHFVDCTMGRAEPISGPAQGLETMRLQDRVLESAERGTAISVSGS